MTGTQEAGRRRTKKGEATRQRIIEACIDCLRESGYSGTSIEAIMSRAGISRGSVLNQFPTRLELMTAAVEAAVRILVDDVAKRMAAFETPEAKLRGMYDVLWANQNIPESVVITELLLAARWDTELADVITRTLPAFETEFDEAMRQVALAASVRDAEACVLRARMLVLGLRGITLELMFNQDREIIQRALREIGALYVNFCDYMLGVTDVRVTPAARGPA